MKPFKTFDVFGEPVEVLVSADMSHRSLSVITQTCQPGGGPPPHLHHWEDEFFMVLEGQFEILQGRVWCRLEQRDSMFGPREIVHTFRNCGNTPGKIMVAATLGGLDSYLENISPLTLHEDEKKLAESSANQGIEFISGPAFTEWFEAFAEKTSVLV